MIKNEPDRINYKALLIKTMVGLIGLTIAFIIISLIFKEQLTLFSEKFTEAYGVVAVFLGFFITAICPIPLPDHAISAFAMIGGLDFWINVGISTLGSVTGGIIAYHLGRLLKYTKFYSLLMRKYKKQSEHLINNYGAIGLAIAALSPIPDSPIIWVCGALGLPFKKFFWIYLLGRFIKITYFLWFIKMGLLVL